MVTENSVETLTTAPLDKRLLNAFLDPVVLLNQDREVVFANRAAIDVLDVPYEGHDLGLSYGMCSVTTTILSKKY